MKKEVGRITNEWVLDGRYHIEYVSPTTNAIYISDSSNRAVAVREYLGKLAAEKVIYASNLRTITDYGLTKEQFESIQKSARNTSSIDDISKVLSLPRDVVKAAYYMEV